MVVVLSRMLGPKLLGAPIFAIEPLPANWFRSANPRLIANPYSLCHFIMQPGVIYEEEAAHVERGLVKKLNDEQSSAKISWEINWPPLKADRPRLAIIETSHPRAGKMLSCTSLANALGVWEFEQCTSSLQSQESTYFLRMH